MGNNGNGANGEKIKPQVAVFYLVKEEHGHAAIAWVTALEDNGVWYQCEILPVHSSLTRVLNDGWGLQHNRRREVAMIIRPMTPAEVEKILANSGKTLAEIFPPAAQMAPAVQV